MMGVERADSDDLQDVVLDMFFDLLNIKAPAWYQTFLDGRRLTSEKYFFCSTIMLKNLLQCIERREIFVITL